MEHQDWQKDKYLKMPEHFSDTVDACVNRQLSAENKKADAEQGYVYDFNRYKENRGDAEMGKSKKDRRPGKYFGWKKAVACVAALVIVVGGSAWAASYFHLSDYLGPDTGADTQEIEEHIQIIDPVSQTVEADLPELLRGFKLDTDTIFMDPLIQIKEVYFDGAELHIYGEPTEAGKAYDLGTSRIFVGGVQYAGEINSVKKRNSEGESSSFEYYGRIQLADAQITDDFTVQIPFTVYNLLEGNIIGAPAEDGDSVMRQYIDSGEFVDESGGRYNLLPIEAIQRIGFQTISINVSVTDNAARVAESQNIEIENGIVSVTKLTLSPSTMHICYTWRLTGEDAREKIEALSCSGIDIMDDQGNIYDSMALNGGVAIDSEIYQDENGAWCTDKEYFYSGVPMDIASLTIMPYSYKDLENLNLSKGKELDYGNFKVTFEYGQE